MSTPRRTSGSSSSMSRRHFMQLVGAAASASPAGAMARSAGGPDEVLDIVIIGAGIAGLTAARDLTLAGCKSFVVLEARDRVGGRTYNHDLGGGRFSEGGGQWIGPGQTAVADLARELGIGTFPTYYSGKTVLLAGNGRVATDLHGAFGSSSVIVDEIEKLARTVPSDRPWEAPRAAELDSISLGEWLATKNLSPDDHISWVLAAELSGGTAPSKLSLLYYLSMLNSAGSYAGLESIKGGAQELRLEGGSQQLSLKMAESLGDKLHLSSPVSRISGWEAGPVSVHTEHGVFRARSVILALSPGLCNQITFDPPLPARRRDLQERWPTYAPAMKTVHVYSEPFWRKKGLSGWILTTDTPVLMAYDNSPEDASLGVINAFVMQGMVPSDTAAATSLLSSIFARALGEGALHPIGYHALDWGGERWTLSCVSPMPPRFLTSLGDALHPPCGRLIWSGTETARIWNGYMDGAVRSGHSAALSALRSIA